MSKYFGNIPATITGRVVEAKHVGTSSMGNPTFAVTIDMTAIEGTPTAKVESVTLKTRANSGIAYAIANSTYRHADTVFTLSKAGTIINAKAV